MHTEHRTTADVTLPESPACPLNVVLGGAPLLGRLTGIGRYTYELARALVASQIVDDLKLWGDLSFLDAGMLKRDDPTSEGPAGLADKKNRGRSGSLAVSARAFASRSYYASMVYQYVSGAMAERRLRPLADSHLYHSPNFIMPHFDGARVITIHDLSTIRFPQFHRKQMVVLCEGGINSAIEGKAHVITDSFNVRDELVKDFGVEGSRISTVHLAPDPRCRPRHESECRHALDALGLSHKAFFLSAIFSTMSSMCFFSPNASFTSAGVLMRSLMASVLLSLFMPLLFDIEHANRSNAASCVVNAFVEATPISGPAFVNIFQSDSLAIVLVGTLQMVSEPK